MSSTWPWLKAHRLSAAAVGLPFRAVAPDPTGFREFYESSYTHTGEAEAAFRRWRALGALTKSDHICKLLELIPPPRAVLEVGCGDGAVLAELGRRGIGDTRTGIDISSAAIRLAADRPGVTAARVFDGVRIESGDGSYDLVVCTHVLEHVVEPLALLAEITRVGRAIVIEVPLERNLSARRAAARALSQNAGHLQRFDRAGVRSLIAATGWRVRGELLDPLPRAVHTFGAGNARALAKGYTKWTVRSMLAAVPPVGERLMTLHYAALATPAAP
jgi:SAM-dependent methyltransferase